MADPTPGTTSVCRHCGQRIVLVNWAIRPSWTHQSAGASFQDGMHDYCHRTLAVPTEDPDCPHDSRSGDAGGRWRCDQCGADCGPNTYLTPTEEN